MRKDNLILKKSYCFSIRIIKLYQHLREEHKEYTLSKQILKCGTSIGANAEEAIGGASKKDFIAKLQISYKEARETHYWLRLLHDTNYINNELYSSMIDECEELQKILFKIISTSKQTL